MISGEVLKYRNGFLIHRRYETRLADSSQFTLTPPQRLFTGDGERTEYLSDMLNFVNSYQAEHQRTQEFCNRLKELDLFEPMKAQITLPSGNQRSLTGFLAVSRERLKKLDGDMLVELARNDSLELIYLHLSSMRNFEVIAVRAETESQAEAGGKKKANGSS